MKFSSDFFRKIPRDTCLSFTILIDLFDVNLIFCSSLSGMQLLTSMSGCDLQVVCLVFSQTLIYTLVEDASRSLKNFNLACTFSNRMLQNS